MDDIMVGPWMLSSQSGLDHGRFHDLAMDALFSERIRPWTSSWLGRGCKGNTANIGGCGTGSKANAVNTDGFGTCRILEFGGAGNTDGIVIFGLSVLRMYTGSEPKTSTVRNRFAISNRNSIGSTRSRGNTIIKSNNTW